MAHRRNEITMFNNSVKLGKIMKKCLILLLLMFLIPLTSAVQTTDIEIRISNSKSLVNYDIQTDKPGIQLILPEDAVINEISEKNYSLKDGILISKIPNGSLKLNYFTDTLIDKNSKSYFTANFKIPMTDNLNVRLILPEFAILENSFPNPELTSDGKHIILNWKAKNTDNFPVFVIYREKSDFQWLWILLAVIILAAIILFLAKKPKVIKVKASKPKKEIHLLESENAVIKAIKEANGEMWQKQIQIKTGFSKAKLSRVIRNLEARNLVKRIPLGNTNKIKLK